MKKQEIKNFLRNASFAQNRQQSLIVQAHLFVCSAHEEMPQVTVIALLLKE